MFMPAKARRIIQFPAHNPHPVYNRRKQPAARRRRWPRFVMLCVVFLYLVWAGSQLVRQEMRMQALEAQYQTLAKRQAALGEQNEALQEELYRVLHDPQFLEQLARRMGMVKPGDTVYVPARPLEER